MAKQETSQEYFPPLIKELPPRAFASFEGVLRKGPRPVLGKRECLSESVRQCIYKAAYLLIDGMHRHDARPQAKHVLARLNEVIKELRAPIGEDTRDWLERFFTLLRKDGAGEVVQSLLPPFSPPHVPPISLSRERLLVLRKDVLGNALLLRRRQQRQYDRDGAEPASYRDVFILAMAEIYRELGAEPVAYAVQQAKDHSLFVKFVVAVAKEAVMCFAPELLSGNSTKRRLLSPGSLSELAIKVLRSKEAKKITG